VKAEVGNEALGASVQSPEARQQLEWEPVMDEQTGNPVPERNLSPKVLHPCPDQLSIGGCWLEHCNLFNPGPESGEHPSHAPAGGLVMPTVEWAHDALRTGSLPLGIDRHLADRIHLRDVLRAGRSAIRRRGPDGDYSH
jgi:hypothetical protein